MHYCIAASDSYLIACRTCCVSPCPFRQASSKPRQAVSGSAREVAKDIEERLAKLSPAEEVRDNQDVFFLCNVLLFD